MNKDEFITEMAYKVTPLTDKPVSIEELLELEKQLCKNYKGDRDEKQSGICFNTNRLDKRHC